MRCIAQLLLTPMPSCAREIHVLCFKSILVAYLSMEALCCLEVVVAGSWLYHFGSCPAIELPRSYPVAS